MDSIPISDDDAGLIERQMKSGRFESAEEVISAGLRLLDEVESGIEGWLARETPRRFAELAADPSIGVSAETVRANLDALHQRTKSSS